MLIETFQTVPNIHIAVLLTLLFDYVLSMNQNN